MTLYTAEVVSKLIKQYNDREGDIICFDDGVLGYGTIIMCGEKLKTAIVKEIPLDSWNCAYKIRKYNKCPKKYKKMIEEFYGGGNYD